MTDLTTYLERGLEIEVEEADAFFAVYELSGGAMTNPRRTLGDAIHQESRQLLAVTNPYMVEGRVRVLCVPHAEAGTLADAMALVPETVEITRIKPGVYQNEEPTEETLVYELHALRPTETRVTYDEALKR